MDLTRDLVKVWFPRPWSTRSTQWPRIDREGAKQPKMPTMDDQPSFCGRQMTPSPSSHSLLFGPLQRRQLLPLFRAAMFVSVSQTISGHSIRRRREERKEGAAAVTAKIAREPLDLERRRANRKKARVHSSILSTHLCRLKYSIWLL